MMEVQIDQEIKALIDILVDHTGLNYQELFDLALFLYYPELYKDMNDKPLKFFLFFDKSEQKWLRELSKYWNTSEEETIQRLLSFEL